MSNQKKPWKEGVWRLKPTPEEQKDLDQLLAAKPEAKWELEEEKNLTQLLHRLPDVPVDPQFTQKVLAQLEPVAVSANVVAFPRWQPWLWRAAAVVVVAGLAWLGVSQYENQKQAAMAESVAFISRITQPALPAEPTSHVGILENVEAIQFLDADDDLVLALE